jgi:hypothetical protein
MAYRSPVFIPVGEALRLVGTLPRHADGSEILEIPEGEGVGG